jgi:hypothetical protein
MRFARICRQHERGIFVESEGAEKGLGEFQKLLRENAPPGVASIEVQEIASKN